MVRMNFGGWRTWVAFSNAYASLTSVASLNRVPKNDIPTGSGPAKPGRHRDARVAGDRRRGRRADRERVALAERGHPRRAVGRRDDRVEVVSRPASRRSRCAQRSWPSPAAATYAGSVRSPLVACACSKISCPKNCSSVGVPAVEGDQVGEVGRVVPGRGGQVGVDVVLELEQQRGELVVERAELVLERQVDAVDDGRRRAAPRPRPGRIGDSVSGVGHAGAADATRRSACPAARSGQAVEVVAVQERPGRGGRAGRRVDAAGSRRARAPRRRRCVAIGPAVSCSAEIGTMPDRLTRPSVGLIPTTPFVPGRADDRAVGLGADGDRGEVGGDGRAGAAGRAARVAVEHVRVVGLPADARSSR